MKLIIASLCFVMVLPLAPPDGWAQTATEAIGQDGMLDNGIYAVLETHKRDQDVQPRSGTQKIRYTPATGWGKAVAESTFLLVHDKPDVQIRLAKAPVVVNAGEDDERLNVRLTDESSKQLRRFTEQHVGRKVAMIVGGKVAFVLTVRSPIDGPDLQISFCEGGGAEQMKAKLMADQN